jgi:hypothetical protein
VTAGAGADSSTPAAPPPAPVSSAQGSSRDNSSSNIVPHRTWRDLLLGQAQQGPRPASPAAAGAAASAAGADTGRGGREERDGDALTPPGMPPDRADKLMGWTEGNLSQVGGWLVCSNNTHRAAAVKIPAWQRCRASTRKSQLCGVCCCNARLVVAATPGL